MGALYFAFGCFFGFVMMALFSSRAYEKGYEDGQRDGYLDGIHDGLLGPEVDEENLGG